MLAAQFNGRCPSGESVKLVLIQTEEVEVDGALPSSRHHFIMQAPPLLRFNVSNSTLAFSIHGNRSIMSMSLIVNQDYTGASPADYPIFALLLRGDSSSESISEAWQNIG